MTKNIPSYSFVYTGNVRYTRKSINLDTFSSIDLPILHKPATVATYACLAVVLTRLKTFQFRIKTQLTSVLNAKKISSYRRSHEERQAYKSIERWVRLLQLNYNYMILYYITTSCLTRRCPCQKFVSYKYICYISDRRSC